MDSKPIKVDMTLFLKEPKMVLLMLNPQWKTVKDLQDRVKKLFNIKNDLSFQTSDGDCYIPEDEAIELIKHVTSVKAFEPKYSRISTTDGLFPAVPEVLTVKKRKRKCNNFETGSFAASTPIMCTEKRFKSTAQTSDQEMIKTKSKTSAQNKKDMENKTTASNGIANGSQGASKNLIEMANTKKNSTISHIRFDSTDDVSLSNNHERGIKISFHCSLEQDTDKTPRLFPLSASASISKSEILDSRPSECTQLRSEMESLTTKAVSVSLDLHNTEKSQVNEISDSNSTVNRDIEITNNKCDSVSQTQADSDVISLTITDDEEDKSTIQDTFGKETTINSEISSNFSSNKSVEIAGNENTSTNMTEYRAVTISQVLSSCINLETIPAVDDIIAFRVSLLSGDPSQYFVGKCEYVHYRTKSLKFIILDGHAEIQHIPPKYMVNLDVTNSDCQCINIKYPEMIEPKKYLERAQ